MDLETILSEIFLNKIKDKSLEKCENSVEVIRSIVFEKGMESLFDVFSETIRQDIINTIKIDWMLLVQMKNHKKMVFFRRKSN